VAQLTALAIGALPIAAGIGAWVGTYKLFEVTYPPAIFVGAVSTNGKCDRLSLLGLWACMLPLWWRFVQPIAKGNLHIAERLIISN
jgi:hypothetical protein